MNIYNLMIIASLLLLFISPDEANHLISLFESRIRVHPGFNGETKTTAADAVEWEKLSNDHVYSHAAAAIAYLERAQVRIRTSFSCMTAYSCVYVSVMLMP